MTAATTTLREALRPYESGRLAEALVLLEELPAAPVELDAAAWTASARARRTADPIAPSSISGAAIEWIDLARDRLRSELGLSVIPGVVPVSLAIRTALDLLAGAPVLA
jgi:hypothetical protein